MHDVTDKTLAHPEAAGDAGLNSPVGGDGFDLRDANMFAVGSHVLDRSQEQLYNLRCEPVKRKINKMRPREKNFDGLPEPARRLGLFRLRLGMNQESMAAVLGVTQQAVSAWEAGKNEPGVPAYGKLLALAEQEGAENDYRYFLGQIRNLLLDAGIPIDELRRPWSEEERRRSRRRA